MIENIKIYGIHGIARMQGGLVDGSVVVRASELV